MLWSIFVVLLSLWLLTDVTSHLLVGSYTSSWFWRFLR